MGIDVEALELIETQLLEDREQIRQLFVQYSYVVNQMLNKKTKYQKSTNETERRRNTLLLTVPLLLIQLLERARVEVNKDSELGYLCEQIKVRTILAPYNNLEGVRVK